MSIPFRFIHAADLHLDSPFKGLHDAPSAVRGALSASAFGAVRALTETAIRMEADFIVLAGDLYDSADRSLRAQLALQRQWRRLADYGIGVFVIHGNHDPLSGMTAKLELPGNVHIFGSGEPEGVAAFRRDGALAAHVYGLSYETRAVTENIALRYRPEAEAAPFHLAMLHGNVDGDPSHDPYAPCRLSDLAGAGFDYWALGHIHDRRVLHTYPHVVYSGNIQGRHAKETGDKGCYVVDVSASKEVRMEFVPLDEVRWLERHTAIDGLEGEQELKTRLLEDCEAALAEAGGRAVMLKLILTGRGPMHGKLAADAAFCRELIEDLRESMAGAGELTAESGQGGWLWVHRLEVRSGPAVALETLLEEMSFAGELFRYAEEVLADPAALRAFIAEAEAPLRDHVRLRRLVKEPDDADAARRFTQARELLLDALAGGDG